MNRTQKSKLFETYEEAKFFQITYGGAITFIKQYEERGEWISESVIDKAVADEELRYTSTLTPTGMSIFILNLSAEASLTNGSRYIKELRMQHHNSTSTSAGTCSQMRASTST